MAVPVAKVKMPPYPKTSSNSNNNATDSKSTKQPFDKKRWRVQKYKKNMGNVSEGQGFADKRKQIIVREYRKILKKEKRKLKDEKPIDGYSGENTSGREEEKQSENRKMKNMKSSAYKRAQLEYKSQREEKEKQKQELLRMQSEREDALKKYKDRKIERIKKLSRRTRKGQPVMKDRMELLLEKIQRQVAADQ